MIIDYLNSGGVVMWCIALDALILFSLLAERSLALWHPQASLRRRHRELVHHFSHHHASGERLGPEQALVGLVEHPELTRYLATIRALVVIAPLLGLLGTVGGIIHTFDELLRGVSAATMGGGIAEALVTTQFGIAVAVPGLIGERLLLRRVERLARSHDRAAAEVGSRTIPAVTS